MVRRAVPADAAEVTRLRRLMFESMGLDCDAVDWEAACTGFFEAHFGTADVVGVVVDAPAGDGLAATGVIIDALRCCKIAKDRGIGGPLLGPSAYFMKSPPVQYRDEEAREMVETFAAGK